MQMLVGPRIFTEKELLAKILGNLLRQQLPLQEQIFCFKEVGIFKLIAEQQAVKIKNYPLKYLVLIRY